MSASATPQRTGQLILTRRVGEAIHIGNDVIVTILGVKGNQVRVGVAAPKDVPVHREEIALKIQRERDMTASLGAHVSG